MNEESERVAELVEEALELEPTERLNFLDRACDGNNELRSEVESLLRFQAPAREFIERPAYQIAAGSLAAEDDELKAGTRLGVYEIVSLLGEGGMGQVYLAEDRQLGRTVAIKLVKRALHGAQIGAQFETEERILAALNHPHIAHLYGVAVTPDGLPYFVMEYVEGEPLDRYVAARPSSLPARLALFRKICSAVSYAHQRLVIHRDLKPANIRVTPAGEPKLLDFGIAKLLDSTDEQTPLDRIMTPEYASPEQARGEPLTTASDVYSLGVILYELLTEQKPHRLTSRRPEEIARALTEQTPSAPSVARRSEANSLRGDLDSIVLMAMQKEPERRYSSVAQFADDLRRHLEGWPVSARRKTWPYRSGKFIQRHKVGATAALLIALALLAGIVATTKQARRADRQRARAEHRFQEVRNLANSLIFNLHDAIENLPGSTAAREMIVQEALKYLDSLAREAQDDPALQHELVSAYIRVGNVQGNPNNANLGDTAGARRSYDQARRIAEHLTKLSPTDRKATRDLGVISEKVGDLQSIAGDLTGAVASTRESLAIFQTLAQTDPTNQTAQRSLAISQIKMGDVLGNPNLPNAGEAAGALAHYRSALALLATLEKAQPVDEKTSRFLGIAHERVGTMLELQGEIASAEESYRESQRIREKLAVQHPQDAAAARDAAIAQEKMANIQTTRGDLAAALTNREKSLATLRALFEADPKNVQSQISLAISHIHLGDLLGGTAGPSLERREEARRSYGAAVAILTPLAEKDVPDRRAQESLAEARGKLTSE